MLFRVDNLGHSATGAPIRIITDHCNGSCVFHQLFTHVGTSTVIKRHTVMASIFEIFNFLFFNLLTRCVFFLEILKYEKMRAFLFKELT